MLWTVINKHTIWVPFYLWIYLSFLQRTMFPVDELSIEVDCSASRSYVEIDAIEIVGGIFTISTKILKKELYWFVSNYWNSLKEILIILLFLTSFFLTATLDRCPSPFSQYQNSCYLIKNNIVSGDEAFVSWRNLFSSFVEHSVSILIMQATSINLKA